MSKEGLAFIHDINSTIGFIKAYSDKIKESAEKLENPNLKEFSDLWIQELNKFSDNIKEKANIILKLSDGYYETTKGIHPDDLGGLLFYIHRHHPVTEEIIYTENELLPILKALGLPDPVWGATLSLEEYNERTK